MNLSDDGYLFDPEIQWGNLVNPDVVPFESITKLGCLVLLGEPGIGKTHTVRGEYEISYTHVRATGNDALWIDLRSFASEERLVSKLFRSPEFVSWVEGSHDLHLFLDSLDECLLRIDFVGSLLADEIKEYPVNRLRLRIACRTADWPAVLETRLSELWSGENVGIYELAPLRKSDVREAAKQEALDPEQFLAEVSRKEVVPLAIKPVTLRFLLNTFKREKALPSNQKELYATGCRILCEESNESRIAARLRGDLTADQRLLVAGRIAAVTIFCNKYAVWTGLDSGTIPEEDVTIRDLCGGRESEHRLDFNVDRGVIEEVLSTGLFSSRGADRIGWAHQTADSGEIGRPFR